MMSAREPMTYYRGKMIPRSELPVGDDIASYGLSPIPEQLRGCRFILVKARDKPAIEKGWQTTANYAYDDPRLLAHIAAGGNYGVLPSGGVCILDADKTMRLAELGVLDILLDTFVVKTGRTEGQGSHFYVRCPDAPAEKFILRDPETGEDLGDLRGSGHPSFCVGPGCTHPSGGRYEIVNNAPLLEIPWAKLKETIVDPCTPPEPEVELPAPRPRWDARNKTISEELDLRVSDWLMPRNPRTRGTGEIEGEHPVHGSETGSNLTISADDQEWYCRRHETGGGPLEAFAVAEGMIDCADVRPGCLQDRIPEIVDRLRAHGYEQKLKEARLERVREAHRQREAPVSAAATPTRAEPVAPQSSATDYSRFFTIGKNGGVSLIYSDIADYIADTLHTVTYRGMIYVYDPKMGIHRPNDTDVEQMTQEIAEQCGYGGRITTAKREVLSYVTAKNVRREYPFNRCPGIPVANGVVMVDYATGERTLEPHRPENLYTYRLPVTFDPEAPTDEIDAVIASWVDEDARPLLYQIPAQALLQATVAPKPYKKSYIIHGDTNAAKSSYLELLRRCFGEENTSRVMLQRIGQDRFCLAGMEGKLFNIYDDLDDVPMQNSTVLKTLTGFDMHDVERKGIDSYRARIFAVHVYTCNQPPETPERVLNDAAFWERWEYITFPNYFAVDPGWYDRVLTPRNCSAFFNRVIDHAVEIMQRGSLVIKSNAYDVRDRWKTNSDPIYKFVQENMDRSETGYIHKQETYDAFLAFAHTEGVADSKIPMTLDMFAQAIFKYGFTPARVRIDGKRTHVFQGYTWKSSSQYRPRGTVDSTLSGGVV